jgi:hypothetical protein
MWKALERLIELKETNGKLNKDDRGYNKWWREVHSLIYVLEY